VSGASGSNVVKVLITFSANISKYVSAIFVSELDAPSGPWIDFFDSFDRNEALEGLLCDELLEFEEDTDDREARFLSSVDFLELFSSVFCGDCCSDEDESSDE
jgi:hypothetical protein